MDYYFVSFFAGFLTVLAPCSIFLLPTIIAGSTAEKDKMRPYVIVFSLALSVLIFSLAVKATSLAFVIPDYVWTYFSGALLFLFGITLIFPEAWEKFAFKCKLYKSQNLLAKSEKHQGTFSAIILGASLGPVFSTCSPTFAILLAVVLPASFFQGFINILLFVLGMIIPFLLIGIGGQKILAKFRFLANPHGFFKKILGAILIIIGIMIFTGTYKDLERFIIEKGYLGPVNLENALLEKRNANDKDSKFNDEISSLVQDKFAEFKTDLSLNSIPFDEILSGGPGKDGIPALTDPKFVPVNGAKLKDEDLGIFVRLGGEERYYPFSIMVWHEIVNDTLGGRSIAVTFCPLCGSAIVFDRNVDGKILDFAVSGFLFESNLLMYDRQTESFWSQVRGEAVVGSYTGTLLERIEMQRLSFGELKNKYPDAQVLSENTGYSRDYGLSPYGDYDENEDLYFPVSVDDRRFPAKEIMLIVPVEKTWAAFPWESLKKKGKASISVQSKELNLALEGSEVFASYDGQNLPSYYEMWFSFAVHHQSDGLIWSPDGE